LKNNPFLDGFSEWMDSPEGELSIEVSDAVWELLETASVDAGKRHIIWEDGEELDIDQSLDRSRSGSPPGAARSPKSLRRCCSRWLPTCFTEAPGRCDACADAEVAPDARRIARHSPHSACAVECDGAQPRSPATLSFADTIADGEDCSLADVDLTVDGYETGSVSSRWNSHA
jgi:hypothetical protein